MAVSSRTQSTVARSTVTACFALVALVAGKYLSDSTLKKLSARLKRDGFKGVRPHGSHWCGGLFPQYSGNSPGFASNGSQSESKSGREWPKMLPSAWKGLPTSDFSFWKFGGIWGVKITYLDLAKCFFCRAKFWAKFPFWRGAVWGEVFGEACGEVFHEGFGLVCCGIYRAHTKGVMQPHAS